MIGLWLFFGTVIGMAIILHFGIYLYDKASVSRGDVVWSVIILALFPLSACIWAALATIAFITSIIEGTQNVQNFYKWLSTPVYKHKKDTNV